MKTLTTVLLCVLTAFALACGGYSSSSHATTPPTPGTVPNITALVPDNANAGATGVVLTVNGASFAGTATINWKGTALTTTHVSAAQLTATIPDADLAASGTAAVTVTNPAVGGGIYGGGTSAETSNSMTFTIN
jgi:hypothetical protein